MSKYGVITKDGGQETFNSSKKHLLVNLNADPPHFDVIQLKGSAISIGGAGSTSEIIAKVKHNLPYTPMVAAYFWLTSEVTGSGIDTSGTYYRNFYAYSNLGGALQDYVYLLVDDKFVTFEHYLQAPYAVTSDAPNQPLFCKYYIFSQPAYNNPRYS